MEFHPDKCKVLCTGRKPNFVHDDYILHGKTLASVESASHLGITFTKDLNRNEHVNRTSDIKANKTLGFAWKKFKTISPVLKTSLQQRRMDKGHVTLLISERCLRHGLS